jgi:hypothetical protein
LSEQQRKEIGLWRNVEYIDAVEDILQVQRTITTSTMAKPSQGSNEPDRNEEIEDNEQPWTSPTIILNILQMNLRKHDIVIYVRHDVRFTADSTHEIVEHASREGYALTDLAIEDGRGVYLDQPLVALRRGSRPSSVFVDFELQCLRGYFHSFI